MRARACAITYAESEGQRVRASFRKKNRTLCKITRKRKIFCKKIIFSLKNALQKNLKVVVYASCQKAVEKLNSAEAQADTQHFGSGYGEAKTSKNFLKIF